MWQLVVCVLAQSSIKALSLRTARLVVSAWCLESTLMNAPMQRELRASNRTLSARKREGGIAALVDGHGYVSAIATFDDIDRRILLRDVACGDYVSGSALVRTISRTPDIECAADLSKRWRIAHAYYLV